MVLPPNWNQEADSILTRCRSGLTEHPDGSVELLNPPRPSERAKLQHRYDMLKQSMESSDRSHIGAAVADMLASYHVHRNQDDEDKLKTIAQFQIDLDGIPTWAVARACQEIKNGTAGDVSHIYAPTTIQVKVEARRFVEPHQAEMRLIKEVLDAKPPQQAQISKADSERIKIGLNELAAKIAAERESLVPQDRIDEMARNSVAFSRRSILREYEDAGVKPVMCAGQPVSPSLLKSIGKWPGRSATRDE